ncbi:Nn.00g048770.m01.CDS01 [Neocucurbitaria sp. VM-36]
MQGTMMVAGAQCFVALSMACTVHAILHLANLPVLILLTTIAFFAEDLILFVAGFTPHSRAEIFRLSLLIPACAGILITEYRLSVPGLTLPIPAMLFAGVASALRKLAIKYYPGDLADRNAEYRWLVGMGVLAAIVWIILDWHRQHIMMFSLGSVPLLIANACFSAAALLIGNSIVFPMNTHSGGRLPGTADVQSHRVIRDTVLLLALAGIVGCYSTFSLRRSFITWYQLGSFVLAILCISSKVAHDGTEGLSEQHRDVQINYELVTDDLTLPSENIEANIPRRDARNADSRTQHKEPQGISYRSFLVSIALVVLWTAYLLLNFTEREGHHTNTVLDFKYKPTMSLEVVLSMYKEPIEEVAQLISNLKVMPSLAGATYTIYVKNGEADKRRIRQVTGANSVSSLPNVGREAETYLNHILNRWDSLAKQTIFLQADVHNQREFYPHLNQYFEPDRTGFLSLGWSGSVCSCGSCGDKFFWRDETHLFPAIQSRIDNSSTCRTVLLSYKGQFIVSAKRIRGIDKAIYHDLQQAFVNEKSWAHHEDYIRGRPDSMSQPWFGYTMERMWNLLFQCNDMDVAWKCPTLLSGWRSGGDIGDCQCFD